jgi:hypothetical protein
MIFEFVLLGAFMVPGEPMLLWDWFLSMRVSRRRKALIKAHHERVERGENHKDYRFIKPFSKTENLPYFGVVDNCTDVNGCQFIPRLIQAPHDETHLDAGPYLKPLTHRLKEVWHCENWLFYASVSPDKLDKWLARNIGATSWFMSDYSAFDATWSAQAWDLIERIYRSIYPDAPPSFWEVLDIWRTPHGKVRMHKENVKIEYQAEVCNASGRDDTALGNAILNGVVMSMSFAAALAGKDVGDLTVEDMHHASLCTSIAIVGDDSCVACSYDVEMYKDQIVKNIEGFGLSVKANTSYSVLDITFLGMMPYLANRRYTWGPTIGRRSYKAYWKVDPAPCDLAAWTRGVAQQLKLYCNVPVMYDLACKIDELLQGQKVTKMVADEYSVWTQVDSPRDHWDSQTLDWVAARYSNVGLTVAQMTEDLQTIAKITRLPAVVHLWTFQAAVVTDEL